jgi:nicotinate-nucleotide adenylyltransferase
VEGRRLGTPLTASSSTLLPDLSGATGVLGGTFDPPHLGHLAIAEDVRETLGLRRILLLPAGLPPHKPDRPVSPAADRLAMLELAVAGNAGFEVSRVEVDRPGPSYSADTVDALRSEAKARGEDDRFVLILSGEALSYLPSWHEPERLLQACHIAVVERPGTRTPGRPWVGEHFPGLEDRIVFLTGPRLCHSSTDIRDRVARGRSIRYLVPPAVADYIAERQLYTGVPWTEEHET